MRVGVYQLSDENRYDVVFTWGVLTVACRDQNQLLDALIGVRKALRAGGQAVVDGTDSSWFLPRTELDLGEFLAVMRQAGFEVKASAPLHFWPVRLALCYVAWPAWLTMPVYHFGQAAMGSRGLPRSVIIGRFSPLRWKGRRDPSNLCREASELTSKPLRKTPLESWRWRMD